MATSGSKSVAVTSWDTLKFSWSILSQSVENNTSTVKWVLQLIAGSAGKISSSASKDWAVTVNGTRYSGTNKIGISNNATKTLASGTTTIAHNADGTKTFSYSFSQEIDITFSGEHIGTISGSGSGVLKTIVQKSALTVDNGTLGVAQVLAVSRYSTNWTHTITYKCGEASGTVCEKSSSEEISFTPPLSLASENTAGTTVPIVFTIETFGEGESAGTNSAAITCNIPESVVPSVILSVSDPTGYNGTYGGYIQNVSQFHIEAVGAGSYGSTISAYKITADGKVYTADSITTDIIAGNGQMEIVAAVTDSRGRTGTKSLTVNVLEYSPPRVLTLTAKRCNEVGGATANGAYMAVVFDADITPLDNRNTAAYTLQYKRTSDSEYTEVVLADYAGQYSIEKGQYIFAAATSATYDVILTASDVFSSTPRGAMGASVTKLWSVYKKGLGFALGKIAALENVFDVAFKSRFLGGFLYPEISTGADLNTYTTPNRYTLKAASAYVNAPAAEVDAILDIIGRADEALLQRFRAISKTAPKTYERIYDEDGWGAWVEIHEAMETNIGNILAEIEKMKAEMPLAGYPIGSPFLTFDTRSPDEILGGGEWELIDEGQYLFSAGFTYEPGSTGGADSYNLSVAHKHTAPIGYSASAVGGVNINGTTSTGSGKAYRTSNTDYSGTLSENVTAFYTGNATVSAEIPIQPRFIAVYMWRRIG